MKSIFLKFVVFITATLFFFNINAQTAPKVKYVFLFIGDGMGLNQVFLTEKYNENFKRSPLVFLGAAWKFGIVKTECADSNKITDSGAGGTAIACGQKTKYGSIGEYNAKPLQSIAEYLHSINFKTGLITSVPINHATPACLYGHEPTRRNYDNLINDLMESKFDLFAGGGFLTGNADTSKNIYKNFNNVLNKLKTNKFQLVLNEDELKKLNNKCNFPLIVIDTAIRNKQSLIKNAYIDEKNALPFALDFPEYKGKLAQFTEIAENVLYNEYGFFIMVEGGKIDWACHDNDALTAIYEIDAFNDAIKKAYDFYRKYPDNTLIIVTADHETGGMSQGAGYDENSGSYVNSYALYVSKFSAQKKSYLFLDGITLNDYNNSAQIGWTTNEHTSMPVGIWSIGPGSGSFTGIMQNSDLKEKILRLVR